MQVGLLNIPKITIEPFSFIHDFQTRVYVQYADIVEKTDIGRAVVQALGEDPRVVALDNTMISCGSGAQRFERNTLAMWFLWAANEYGLQNANAYLEEFLKYDEITAINTLWVVGIEVDHSIDLGEGYTITPINEMPDSRDKELFLQSRFKYLLKMAPIPTCAITKTCRVKKTRPGDAVAETDDLQEYWNISQRLHDISLLLNTVYNISCLPYFSTSYSDPTTPFGPFAGSGGGSPLYDVQAHGSDKFQPESTSIIKNLLTQYENLPEKEKSRIQRILNRLSQAKRRTQIEDKILDLGITLEMLLLDDNSNNDQLSLSFRLRGSWLLGESTEHRIKLNQQFKEIYIYRSQVAHSGNLCNSEAAKIEKVREVFAVYQHLAESICQHVILHGRPDWNALILGSI